MKVSHRTQAERSTATRNALIAAARRLFSDVGFGAVGTEAIVAAAGVSRGALYHQFDDKTELFAAVLGEVQRDVRDELQAAIVESGEARATARLTVALHTWLEACRRPEIERIALLDGPSVLGWSRWRAICHENVLGLVESTLHDGIDDGEFRSVPPRAMAHLLLAMADEAALYANDADDRDIAVDDLLASIAPLLRALATD